MSAADLIHQFQFNQMVLTRLLEDVTPEESLKAAGPGGKCIHWLLIHILKSRGDLVALLSAQADWSATELEDLHSLRKTLEHSFERIAKILQSFDPGLKEICPGESEFGDRRSFAQRVGSFVCHEAYHAGQIGLLRRLLGKPGLF